MTRNVLLFALGLVACSSRAPNRVVTTPVRPDNFVDRIVRVVLPATTFRVSATADFAWHAEDGGAQLALARRGESWRLERERPGVRIRAVAPEGNATPWGRALVVRVAGSGFLQLNGRRYRGEFVVLPVDSTVMVVNRLRVEDYVRGVVPVEIGKRPATEIAALQAQAVAARSYTYVRLADPTPRAYDLRPTIADQVYGGVSVEYEAANEAVDATRGLVLLLGSRVVDAPFFSTCGGSTADAPEVWRGAALPYLVSVSDRIGNTARFYCDNAARFRWTRTLSASQVNATLAQYLKSYASVPASGPGLARDITIRSRGRSGRVAAIDIETDRGVFPVRGDDIRSVLRPPGGEALSSTYFSVAPEYDSGGLLGSVTIHGQGYGHGVGMCQWGAIGRARAGQSFRTILGTYYPGTTVGPVQ